MTGYVEFGGASKKIPMKTLFRNGSNRIITVRLLHLDKQLGDQKTMAPGDSICIPDVPGEYIVELLA